MKGIQAAKLCGSPIISVVRKERNSATHTQTSGEFLGAKPIKCIKVIEKIKRGMNVTDSNIFVVTNKTLSLFEKTYVIERFLVSY